MTKPSDGDSHRTEPSLPPTAQSAVSTANVARSALRELWLVRHGETEWSKAMRHTGRTDLPLTEHGRRQARDLEPVLAAHAFDLVLSSPLRRARETATLADYNSRVQLDENLMEWDYGTFEGQTASELARRLGSSRRVPGPGRCTRGPGPGKNRGRGRALPVVLPRPSAAHSHRQLAGAGSCSGAALRPRRRFALHSWHGARLPCHPRLESLPLPTRGRRPDRGRRRFRTGSAYRLPSTDTMTPITRYAP
jgi:uncharacterized membrane protein